ncbi:MAG: hypothetical protein CMO98_01445 [Woeseia sp.]|nr:hypothetical protein [Woeseia sp.]
MTMFIKKIKSAKEKIRQRALLKRREMFCNGVSEFSNFYQKIKLDMHQERKARIQTEMHSQGLCGQTVSKLDAQGIASWEGMLSNAELNELRVVSTIHKKRWEEIFSSGNGEKSTQRVGNVVYTNTGFQQDGRARAFFTGKFPNAIANVVSDPRVRRICECYLGANYRCTFALAEWLTPSERGDFWHFDRLDEQLKIMILLDDVEIEQGPLRYKAQTNYFIPELASIYLNVFRDGIEFAYPPGPLVEAGTGEVLYGIGNAGDVIFFDTTGIHSGTPCLVGERQVMVLTFRGRGEVSQRLRELGVSA